MFVEKAKRDRKCKGTCNKPILPNESCLVIITDGFHKMKNNYCKQCGLIKIKSEILRLEELKTLLDKEITND